MFDCNGHVLDGNYAIVCLHPHQAAARQRVLFLDSSSDCRSAKSLNMVERVAKMINIYHMSHAIFIPGDM
jgi:hypothetical protein